MPMMVIMSHWDQKHAGNTISMTPYHDARDILRIRRITLTLVKHRQEITWCESNDHVMTDDVTWPRKVKTVTQIINLSPNISEFFGDGLSVPKERLYEIAHGKSNGHVTDDVTRQIHKDYVNIM